MLDLIETKGIKTFKVEAKRADKNFPVKSPEIGRIIGAKVLIGCKVLKVDVHNPDVHLFVDVRHDKSLYLPAENCWFWRASSRNQRKRHGAFVRRHRQSRGSLDDGQKGACSSKQFIFIPIHTLVSGRRRRWKTWRGSSLPTVVISRCTSSTCCRSRSRLCRTVRRKRLRFWSDVS